MSQMSQWVRSVRIKVLVETIKFSFISFSEKSRGIQCSFIPWIVVDHEHTTEDDPGKTIYVLKRSNNQLQSCFQLITLIPNVVHHFFQSVLLASKGTRPKINWIVICPRRVMKKLSRTVRCTQSVFILETHSVWIIIIEVLLYAHCHFK